MINPALINKALVFAQKAHNGQTRKVSGVEYFTHPLEVSYLCAQFKQSKNMDKLICAAILHDVIEDTNITFGEIQDAFGPTIACLVWELTDDKQEKDRVGKFEYQKQKWVGLSSYALFLKLCDRLSNMTDSPSDKSRAETKKLIKTIEQKRKLTASQKAVVCEIKKYL